MIFQRKKSQSGRTPAVAWANDDKTVFYVENDPVTLLSTRVKKHVLGTDPKTDPVVYEEPDHSFYMYVSKSGDDRYVMITLGACYAAQAVGAYRALQMLNPMPCRLVAVEPLRP